jgi:hypothetical protein
MFFREKAEEHRADLYKLLGLALATPFSVIFSSMLIDNQYLIRCFMLGWIDKLFC